MDGGEIKMENNDLVYVEVKEGDENIIYLEKVEDDEYLVVDNDFCVVECEIATSPETASIPEDNENPIEVSTQTNDPVEVIFLHKFGDEEGDNPLIVSSSDDVIDDNAESESFTSSVKSLKSYMNKNHGFVKCKPVDNLLKLRKPIKKRGSVKTVAQTQKLNKALELTSTNICESLGPRSSCQEHEASEHTSDSNSDIPRLSFFSQQRPKLWSHRVDRRNFEGESFFSTFSNMTSQQMRVKEGELSELLCNARPAVNLQALPKRRDLPYQCEACDKSFRQPSSLVIHLKVHAGVYADNCSPEPPGLHQTTEILEEGCGIFNISSCSCSSKTSTFNGQVLDEHGLPNTTLFNCNDVFEQEEMLNIPQPSSNISVV